MSKILVVEDNPEFREMLATVLRAEGHNVITAQNGLEAINKVELLSPDLIITDIHMPALNGLEMIRWIRLNGRLKNVPIIGMTAYPQGGLDLAIKAGASVSLPKPVELGRLIEHIEHLLRPESVQADGSKSSPQIIGFWD